MARRARGSAAIFDIGLYLWGFTVADSFQSARDVILRTQSWDEASKFYGTVLGLAVTYRSKTIIGFETGSFCLYVEKGDEHGAVFEFFVPDLEAAKCRLTTAGCTVVEENGAIPRCYIRDPYGLVFNVAQVRADK